MADSKIVESTLNAVNTMAQLRHSALYVYDISSGELVYASEVMKDLFGGHLDLRELNKIYNNSICPEDAPLTKILYDSGLTFFHTFMRGSQASLSYDLRVKVNRRTVMIHHKSRLLLMKPDGSPWLVVTILSPSSSKNSGNIHIAMGDYQYTYMLSSDSWEREPRVKITALERSVLACVINGYSNEQIATQISRSVDSVKYYRKQIFQKLGVTSMPAAVIAAFEQDLI